jgi:hypothetical protein
MERNMKVFRAHRALSWLYLVVIALFALLAFSQPAMLGDVSFYSLLAIFVALFLAHYLTARGARESKPWARTSSIVISLFLLLGFPVGTLIGIYLLSNTWKEWDDPVIAGA